MKNADTTDTAEATVHCWDPQVRRCVCGAPGNIGSTKHVKAVTCSACLELLGSPGRAPVSLASE
jgi:hypothetical protein